MSRSWAPRSHSRKKEEEKGGEHSSEKRKKKKREGIIQEFVERLSRHLHQTLDTKSPFFTKKRDGAMQPNKPRETCFLTGRIKKIMHYDVTPPPASSLSKQPASQVANKCPLVFL